MVMCDISTVTEAMPTMHSAVEAFRHQASLVPARVAYAQAQPRTRSEQLRWLEKVAEAVLLAPGLKIRLGVGGQLILRLPIGPDDARLLETAEEAEAVH